MNSSLLIHKKNPNNHIIVASAQKFIKGRSNNIKCKLYFYNGVEINNSSLSKTFHLNATRICVYKNANALFGFQYAFKISSLHKSVIFWEFLCLYDIEILFLILNITLCIVEFCIKIFSYTFIACFMFSAGFFVRQSRQLSWVVIIIKNTS